MSGVKIRAKGSVEQYSGIEHLAKITVLSRGEWREVQLAMLTACFDASGSDHDQLILVVAGFISSAKNWVVFETEWKKRLGDDGISCFHMVEFAGCKGEFEGWEEERRQNLLADLMDIIKRYTYQLFGCVILNKEFQEGLSEDIRNEFYFNAYSLAARTCASNVFNWLKEKNEKSPVKFVFEDGDLGKGLLMSNFKRDGYPAPIFALKRDRSQDHGAIMPGFTPLQAADFLAYELFLSIKHKTSGRLEDKPLRWAMKRFMEMDQDDNLRIYQPEDLAELSRLIELSKEQFGDVKFGPFPSDS